MYSFPFKADPVYRMLRCCDEGSVATPGSAIVMWCVSVRGMKPVPLERVRTRQEAFFGPGGPFVGLVMKNGPEGRFRV